MSRHRACCLNGGFSELSVSERILGLVHLNCAGSRKIFLGIDGGSDAAKSAAESAANASRAAADAAHSAANATRFIANITAAVADSTRAAALASEAAANAASYAMWMNVFVIAIIIVIVWCNWTSLLNYVSARPETVLRSEEDFHFGHRRR